MRDREIEGAIARLTRLRSDQAPPLDQLLDKPRRRRSLPWWVAAAAIVAPAAVLVFISQIGPDRPSLSEASRAIAEWRAPSDVFLPSSDGVWQAGAPPLGSLDLTFFDGTARSSPAAAPDGEVNP